MLLGPLVLLLRAPGIATNLQEKRGRGIRDVWLGLIQRRSNEAPAIRQDILKGRLENVPAKPVETVEQAVHCSVLHQSTSDLRETLFNI